jgi:hypothetical protein
MDALNVTLLIVGALALLYPLATVGFRLLIAGRDFIDSVREHDEFSADLLSVIFFPAVLAFGPIDVSFNLVWGSLIFRERPHEWVFTSRVERHYRTCSYAGPPTEPRFVHAITLQQVAAVYWADWLNSIDPQHVTMHKG